MSETTQIVLVNGKADLDERLLDALRTRRAPGDLRFSERAGDLERWASEADVDTVWVIGGDGSVNEAARGLLTRQKQDRPALGIIPGGTANDYARGLGLLDLDPVSIAEGSTPLRPQRIDVLAWGDAPALNQVTVGAPASITASTPQPLKDALGGLAYAIHGATQPSQLRAFAAQVRGGDLDHDGEALMLGFGVGPFGGGGIPVHPEASFRDGHVHAVVVTPTAILRATAARFDIQIPGDMPANLDGEPAETHPEHIGVLAGALSVLIP